MKFNPLSIRQIYKTMIYVKRQSMIGVPVFCFIFLICRKSIIKFCGTKELLSIDFDGFVRCVRKWNEYFLINHRNCIYLKKCFV